MIKFDFDSTVLVNNQYLDRMKETINKLYTYDETEWDKNISFDNIKHLINKRNQVINHSEILVVIGIGGSYLGSKALYDMFNLYFDNGFEVIYAGNNLSSNYLNDLMEYLTDKDFTLNVISKSGNTMEVKIAYNIIKEYMKEIYSKDELQKRIIITTGNSGYLYEEALKNNYYLLKIPKLVGGRYSLMTPAHLFPLSFNIDIEYLISGYNDGINLKDMAFKYASIRKSLFDNHKLIENFTVFEPKLQMFAEWLKQLFGESEGKNGKGIYPSSSVFTTDLHALEQFIQNGNKILFETFIIIKNNVYIKYMDSDINTIQNNVVDCVRNTHYKSDVSVNLIELDELNEYNVGYLVRFFFYSAAYSAILFGVEPFNQPGVESYKQEIKKHLSI